MCPIKNIFRGTLFSAWRAPYRTYWNSKADAVHLIANAVYFDMLLYGLELPPKAMIAIIATNSFVSLISNTNRDLLESMLGNRPHSQATVEELSS